MESIEFVVALGVGIACGGYIGVAWDRYQRRHDDRRPEYQRRAVSAARMSRLHVIEDEWLNGPPREDLR